MKVLPDFVQRQQRFLLAILLSSIAGMGFAESPRATPSGFWPGWRGADRSNRSSETGLLSTWPPEGPPLLWTAIGLGHGIASVSVAHGSVYTVGYAEGREYVYALDATTGESRWITEVGPEVRENSLMRWLSQRTPTIDEDRLYTMTAWGELFCLSTSDGSKLWHKSYPTDFASPRPTWGFSDRPLVDGEHLICVPVGPKASVVALSKQTGEIVWTSLVSAEERQGYAATVICTAGGMRQYLVSLAGGLAGIASEDGRVLWQYTKTDPQLVEQSRSLIRDQDLGGRVTIHQADLFTADLTAADVIATYLPTELMTRLLPQFKTLKPGARIVSHQFRIPGFPPHRTRTLVSSDDGEPHRLFLWTAPLESEAPPQELRRP